MKIRPAELRDRRRIHEILVATARFTEDEVRSAMELVDAAGDHPEKGEYIVHVLEEPDSGPKKLVQGYVCYGPTPHTDGVFDLCYRSHILAQVDLRQNITQTVLDVPEQASSNSPV